MKGFTLIELMIVVAIIAVLSTIGVMVAGRALMQARDAKRASIMHDIQTALGLYNIRNQSYPNSPNDFCGMVGVLTTGNYLLVAPVDPKTQLPVCPTGSAAYLYTATPSTGTATSYLLKLVKESGGSLDFLSPQ